VYEQPAFAGAGDVLNGPRQLLTLDRVTETNHEDWRRRIRSLRVGPAAVITAYVEASFKGHSEKFGPATEQPVLDDVLSARIQSLDVACLDRSKREP
jgi:hypothetical protein